MADNLENIETIKVQFKYIREQLEDIKKSIDDHGKKVDTLESKVQELEFKNKNNEEKIKNLEEINKDKNNKVWNTVIQPILSLVVNAGIVGVAMFIASGGHL